MSLELRILQAEHGDSIVISVEFESVRRNILIDGGPAQTFAVQNIPRTLQLYLNEIKEKSELVDLLVLTHVDDDHIGGLLAGFNKYGYLSNLTQEVWFNSGKLIFDHFNKPISNSNSVILKSSVGSNTSTGQGIKLEDHLEGMKNSINKEIWSHSIITAGNEFSRFGCNFKILSPSIPKLQKLLTAWEKDRLNANTSAASKDYDKSFQELLNSDEFIEDKKPHNGSSLAFIFEFNGKKLLLLGDSHPSVIANSLRELGFSVDNRLHIDYVKISHHGSKANTNDDLLSLISSRNFIISTNGNYHGLPNKKTLARIINNFPNANLIFNYPDLVNKIFTKEELINITFSTASCRGIITL
jgi:beta-lactamase superfamily II metal-dependent hydrolase